MISTLVICKIKSIITTNKGIIKANITTVSQLNPCTINILSSVEVLLVIYKRVKGHKGHDNIPDSLIHVPAQLSLKC